MRRHHFRPLVLGALLALLGACSSLLPKPPVPPAFYLIDAAPLVAPVATGAQLPPAAPPAQPPITLPHTLIVSAPLSAAGVDSPRILYLRQPHQLLYFAHSEWVDTPARMLAPLLVKAIDGAATWRAVVGAPSAASGDLRLETTLLRLQQDFTSTPSQVRFTLRATLLDAGSRRVLAWREFDARVAAPSEDAAGGVAAANRAVRQVLTELGAFTADTARGLPATAAPPAAVPTTR